MHAVCQVDILTQRWGNRRVHGVSNWRKFILVGAWMCSVNVMEISRLDLDVSWKYVDILAWQQFGHRLSRHFAPDLKVGLTNPNSLAILCVIPSLTPLIKGF